MLIKYFCFIMIRSFVFAVISLVFAGLAQATDVRCFPRVICEGGVLDEDNLNTPEKCCHSQRGIAYDLSGQQEKCHACEVWGWDVETRHVLFNQPNTLVLTTVKGRGAGRVIFNIHAYYSPGFQASITFPEDEDFIIIAPATTSEVIVNLKGEFIIEAPLQAAGNVSLGMSIDSQQEGRMLAETAHTHYSHYIIPELHFPQLNYTFYQLERNPVVCLVADNVPEDSRAAFSVGVTILENVEDINELEESIINITNTTDITHSTNRTLSHEAFEFNGGTVACKSLAQYNNLSNFTLVIDDYAEGGYYQLGEPREVFVEFSGFPPETTSILTSVPGTTIGIPVMNCSTMPGHPECTPVPEVSDNPDPDLTPLYIAIPVIAVAGATTAIVGAVLIYSKVKKSGVNTH